MWHLYVHLNSGLTNFGRGCSGFLKVLDLPGSYTENSHYFTCANPSEFILQRSLVKSVNKLPPPKFFKNQVETF